MAKGYVKRNTIPKNGHGSAKLPETFTTSHGYVLHIKSIPQMLVDKVKAGVVFPDPPTYEAELASGEKIRMPHDLTTLETDEEKYQWSLYEKAIREAQDLQSRRMLDTLIMKGIEKIPMPETDEWIEDQKFLGVKVPTDPRELYVHYVSTEILYTGEDFARLSEMIMRSTGVSEEKLAEANASFQRALAPKEGENPSTEVESAGE